MKIIAVMICLIGCVLIYCSHRNQNLLKQHLPKKYAVTGLFLLIISVVLLFYSVPKLVAIYMWSMTLIAVWSLIPFVALFKKNTPHETSASTKNST
ncbi:hypothetical protein [Acinetobacter tianfuensis]|uniref:DUF3325 domain-containing protein n=1 Tax=Acinetobacter tianfuensis TaxID=2419603 RepID=A0A3A8E8T6_9GAMM|nr:hypothetical protein [Acinetobacter tianfuensis]RKG31227.1 hypothetical protein D7V32_09075 [Acinetobacter tianfuensis]